MNTTTIARREELCRSLNMNFDEASELFCDETLQSMQMAKVNGGVLPVAPILWKLFEMVIVAGVTYYTTKPNDNGKIPPTQPALDVKPDGTLWLPGTSVQVDSMKVGTDGRVYYWMSSKPGATAGPGPTPTPTYGGAGASF